LATTKPQTIDQALATAGQAERGDAVAAISRDLNSVYVNLYGRGADRARTHVGDDYVLTILEGSLTKAEQTLIDAGNTAQVEETRRAFARAAESDLITAVERNTGRRVRTLLCQMDAARGVSIELFLLDAPPAG
jgi:uncharacterized protein YbcI